MPIHLSRAELEAGLPEILASPADGGRLEAIVVRPSHGERRDLETCEISLAGGLHGDHWAKGCWKSTAEGRPDPDVQICIMNARCIGLIARGPCELAAGRRQSLFRPGPQPGQSAGRAAARGRHRGPRDHRRATQRLCQVHRALRPRRLRFRQYRRRQTPAIARHLCPGGAGRTGDGRRPGEQGRLGHFQRKWVRFRGSKMR